MAALARLSLKYLVSFFKVRGHCMSKIFLIIVLFISGCATTYELEQKSFKKVVDGQYPPISLLIDDGTGGSGNAYEYDSYIFQRFSESNLFQKVGSSHQAWPISILVEYNIDMNGNKAVYTTNFMASAATLFLLPVKEDLNHNLKVTINLNGNVKEYFYTDRIKKTSTILQAVGKDAFKSLHNLLNHFFSELQQDNILPIYRSKNKTPQKKLAL
jgi:hypothetical protein